MVNRLTYALRLFAACAVALAISSATANAQITFVKVVGTKTSKTNTSSLSVTVPASGVAAGHFVVVAFAIRTNQSVSCTDSKGNTYSVETTQTNLNSTGGFVSLTGVCTSPVATALVSGDTIKVSYATSTSAARAISALEFSGLPSSCALDKHSSASSGGALNNSPSSGATRSTAQGNELLIGALGIPGASSETFTVGSGFTLAGRAGTTGGTDITIDPEYQIVSSTGTYNATGTLGTSHTWAATITTYRDARTPQAGATGSLSFGAPANNNFSVADSSSLDPAKLTVEAWIKPAPFTPSVNWISITTKSSTTSWTDGYGMYIATDASSNGTLYFWVTNYSTDVVSAAITAGQWSHVAGTYDGTNLNLYINGNLVATLAYSGGITYVAGAALTIGNNSGGTPYNGELDELRIWNVARTKAQLQANAHVTNLSTDPTLASYWMADDAGCGTTLADSSGNGNTGTLAATEQGVWNTSTAPLASNGAWDETTSAVGVGPTHGTLTATITSTPDDTNNLGLYQYGSLTGGAYATTTAGETFPSGVVARSNIVWGAVSRGTVTANLVIDFLGQPGVVDQSQLTLLTRTDANTMTWTAVTPAPSLDVPNWKYTLSGQTTFGQEYALGFPSAPDTAVTLVSFTATQYDKGVLLQWQTGYEINNLGFNVYREMAGQRTRLTPTLVAGSGLTAGRNTPVNSAHAYAWWDLDPAALSGSPVYYLEDVDFNGTSTFHGPVSPLTGADLAPVLPQSTVLTGLSQTNATTNNVLVTRGEPLARRWGPGEGLKPGTHVDRHEPGPLAIAQVQLETQWAIAARHGLRIGVRNPGWYRIAQPDLVAAGLNPNVESRNLQLFVDGVEQAMLVTGVDDGRFGTRAAIEFYGTGVDTPYTDTHVYWLVAGERPGRRIATLPRGLGQNSGASSSGPASFWMTRQRKDRTIYFAALENGDAENWFGPMVSSQATDFSLELENVDGRASGAADLEVTLQGVTTQSHQVAVTLNGTPVGTVAFDGQTHGVAHVGISQSLLVEGTNTITLAAQGGDADLSLFDTIHVSYWHAYRADGDRLWCTVEGQQLLTLGGFASAAIRVMDVTDPSAIAQVRVTPVSDGAGAFAVRLRVPGTGTRTLMAFTAGTIGAPAYVAPHRPSIWHEATNAADYVVVTHSSFAASLAPLAAVRTHEGHKVAIVDVDDVYAEFSFGEKTPQAMKDFLRRATSTWKQSPRFVVLVGDATIDPRNYAGLGDADFVPTKEVSMGHVSLKTASDDWFVDFSDSGLPDLAIGRLSVRTSAQADTMVNKIVSYSATQAQPSAQWTRNVLLVADENDAAWSFEAASAGLQSYLPGGYQAQQVFRGKLGLDAARAALTGAVNQGQLIVDYHGHGSVQMWGGDGELLTNDDVYGSWRNSGQLPVVVAMDCLNGFFQGIWDEESLGEAMMRAPQGGAVAVWASSSVTSPIPQTALNNELFRLVFGGAYATLGEAVAAAKRSVTDRDLTRTLIFFGDPALHVIGTPMPRGTTTAQMTTVAAAHAGDTRVPAAPQSSDQQDVQAALVASASVVRLADFGGQGHASVLLYDPDSGRWSAASGAGVGGATSGRWGAHLQIVPMNFAGTPRAGLAFYDPHTGAWVQALNTGTSLVTIAQGTGVVEGQVQVGDFTATGHDDVLTYAAADGSWALTMTDGAGAVQGQRRGTWPAGARLHVADLTGDGRADIVGYDAVSGLGFVALNQGAGRFAVQAGTWGSGWEVAVGRLATRSGAADSRRADLFFYHPATGVWYESLSDGQGGFTSWRGTWDRGLTVQLTDLDGDGRDDVVGYNPLTGDWRMAFNRGSGVFATDAGVWTPGLTVATGDLAGAGRGDVVLYDPASGAAFELSVLAPDSFDTRGATWMPGAVFVGQPR